VIRTIAAAAIAAVALAATPMSSPPLHAQEVKAEKAKRPAAKRPLTAGQIAARERQRKCAAEWRAAKAAGTRPKGMTWPKYWSACNRRLKGS